MSEMEPAVQPMLLPRNRAPTPEDDTSRNGGALLAGYAHPLYADSLSEFGRPRELPRCGGWILRRPIPGFPQQDAMGCYPFFSCRDWSELGRDICDIEQEGSLVCLSLVSDPFAQVAKADLRECFPDVLYEFKEHYVVDLSRLPESYVSKHHRRNVAKALRCLRVEFCPSPTEQLDDWRRFYEKLKERHGIEGISAFSYTSFEKQLRVPGMVMFRAVRGVEAVGMILFYRRGDVAYYHLGAYCDEGYRLKASFALFWFALDFFAQEGAEWLSLGAGAGVNGEGNDGLTRFKKGWATDRRTAFFCGRILDRPRYAEIANAGGGGQTDYFPAYRKGEFA